LSEAEPRCCAIIPARGGSKGIVGKNLRVLGGRPLIAHTLLAARESKRIERVVVSTDDPGIAEVARAYGADVVLRPAELASDSASSESALLHTLGSLAAEQKYEPELVAFLQCTSPLTLAQDIDGTIAKLIDEGADSALSVAMFHYFVWKSIGGEAVGVNHDKRVRPRRQDREPEFIETGAVYAMRRAGFLDAKHRFFGKTVFYEMPLERVCEIDELVDLEVAELRLRQRAQSARVAALPSPVEALVMDFDGVHTDNRVFVDQTGQESVSCSREDGLGLELLRKTGLPMLVLSKEQNPVVQARCKKLQLACLSGVDAKLSTLQRWCSERRVSLAGTVFVGNDVNDNECLAAVGCGVAVADAHPDAKRHARIVLERPGGQGALRELCELILEATGNRRTP
jgi:YrbI family 3-deoxy-D-manno-octulosonate 8-phosphate phosphatase